MDLDVLYEDNHIIVVRKPRNMPVCPDDSGDKDLLTCVKEYLKVAYNKPGEAFCGLVHRLDRPAGGLVVFARTSKAAGRLSDALRYHEIERTYMAVVRGLPEKAGKLENYLLKDTEKNQVRIVPPLEQGAKKAVLEYRLVEYSEKEDLSLCRITLQTGRAHQIRAQMAHIGHPLYGDQRYGFGVNKKGQQLSLYAVRLSLVHPVKKENMSFICALPKEFPWNGFRARADQI